VHRSDARAVSRDEGVTPRLQGACLRFRSIPEHSPCVDGLCRQGHDCISSAIYISIMGRPIDITEPGRRRPPRIEVTRRIAPETFSTHRHLRSLPLFETTAYTQRRSYVTCFRYRCLNHRYGHVYCAGYFSSAASAAEKCEFGALCNRKCREIPFVLDKSGGAIYRTRMQCKFMLLFNLYLFKMCLLLGKVTCVSAPTMIMWMTT